MWRLSRAAGDQQRPVGVGSIEPKASAKKRPQIARKSGDVLHEGLRVRLSCRFSRSGLLPVSAPEISLFLNEISACLTLPYRPDGSAFKQSLIMQLL